MAYPPPTPGRIALANLTLRVIIPEPPKTLEYDVKSPGGPAEPTKHFLPVSELTEDATILIGLGWAEALWKASGQKGQHPFTAGRLAYGEGPAANALEKIERLLGGTLTPGALVDEIRKVVNGVGKERF